MKWLEKFDKVKKIKIPDFGKKAISLLTAFVLLTVSIPASEVVNGMSYLVGEIKASAAEEPTYEIKADNTCIINTADQLVQFSNDYITKSSEYKDLTISIGITQGGGDISSKFESIGTSDAPFSGNVSFTNTTPIYLDKPLFNYISDSAVVSKIIIGKKGSTDNLPLFANNVTHNSDTESTYQNSWNITAVTYTDSGGNEQANAFAGVIGTIETDAKVSLNFTNNAKTSDGTCASIKNTSGSVGLACKTMGENSSLDFTLDSTSTNTDYTITATGGNAGGIVGTMVSGANLTLNNSISSTGEVKSETGYAGGVVGYATDATVNFGTDTSVTATVNGSTATGGVFGYYKNTASDYSFDISKYDVNCTLNGQNNGGIFGKLENSNKTVINSTNANKYVSSKASNNIYGGLIGIYLSDATSNSLTINDLIVNSERSGSVSNYGGVIGKIDDDSYVKFKSVTVDAKNRTNTTFGGLVGYSAKAFIDAENVTIKTNGNFNGGGVVGILNSGVLRLKGQTDVSGSGEGSFVVGTRGQALVYAEKDWKLIRNNLSAKNEAIYTWGDVLRFGGDNLTEVNSVLDVNKNEHTVKVLGATPTAISSTAEFAKLALNIQLNNGATENSTLSFEDTTNTSEQILKSEIKLTGNIDLTGTGITGLTRDDGKCADNNSTGCYFTGTFDGGNNTITLATGEIYGNKKDENTPVTIDDNGNGKIYHHHYNGLFAKTSGGATFRNLTLNGSINVNGQGNNENYVYIGGLSAYHHTGAITINSVTASEKIENLDGGTNKYILCGGLVGAVGSNESNSSCAPTITIKNNTTINSTITTVDNNSSSKFYLGGAIAEIRKTSGEINVTADNVTLNATVENSSKNSDKKTGGFIAYVADGSSSYRTVTLNNITINNTTVTTKNDKTVGGGLLGQEWNNLKVTIGDDNSTNGIKVENSTVSYGGSNDLGGLVTIATGYWQVYKIDINGITVNASSADSFGMLVNNGFYVWKEGSTPYPKALYLELENENAYKISNSNLTGLKKSATFDELVADCRNYSLDSSNNKDYTNSDISANGNAVVSIHTSTPAGESEPKVIMDGTNCNTYQNQTSIKKVNPNTRYYYNLDVIRKNVIDGNATNSEKLLLWSVNKYAYGSLSSYFPNPFDNDKILSGDYDMKGYSYYPVDVSGVTVSKDAKFTFCNDKITDTEKKTTEKSQHYLMHCGLFRNVTGNLNVNDTTFSGNVGKVGTDYCGALVCGKISYTPTSSNPTSTVKIDGITLDGIKINGVDTAGYAPLLINKIDSNITFNLSNVKTTATYKSDDTTITAATSLIGDVGSADADNIKLSFSKIVLDARQNAISDTEKNTALDTAYNTTKSIFSKATLLNSFIYGKNKNCSGVYNYNIEEDWNGETPLHQVTYGKEVSDSKEYTKNGQQKQYANSECYTSPESSTADKVYDFSDFLPYVATEYSAEEKNVNHEIKVNHKSTANLDEGCGTYNDPYIISNEKQLKLIETILSNGTPTEGLKINYFKDNYKSWCNGHTTLTYNATTTNFESENKNTTISKDKMPEILSTAYYKLSADIDLSKLGDTEQFLGLGKNVPFKGVIDGSGYTITNNTSNPLIYNSVGSVVKDLTVKVEATLTSLNGGNTATKYLEDGGSTPFYGGIFGIVNGGDNIIDNVSVTFENANSISATGTYAGNVAVGGYVGVVRYGGVIFRNMSGDIDGISTTANSKFGDVSDSSVYLYFNPIIGRVIDGYAFTETDHYTPRETAEPTMQNGTKNYSIADIDINAGQITFDGSTIKVPDGQALFLMGCIAMSGAGSANWNSSYGTTKLGYGNSQMVRHAKYDKIGNVTDENDTDFVEVKSGDKYSNSTTSTLVDIPYIIYKYTSADSSGNYPARSLTKKDDAKNCVFSIELTSTDTYTLPDSFRGIGSMNNSDIYMTLSGFEGNNATIEMNSNFYAYKLNSGYDKYYAVNGNTQIDFTVGLGLFNRVNLKSGEIKNLILSGNVKVKIYKSHTYNSEDYEAKNADASMCAGMLVGSANLSAITVDKITLDNADVESGSVSGGLIGFIKNNTFTATNVNADNLTVKCGGNAGGMIGYVSNSTCNVNVASGKSTFNIKEISSSVANYRFDKDYSVGGLFGWVTGTSIINNIIIQNGQINNGVNKGGVIGKYANGKTHNLNNITVKNLTIEDNLPVNSTNASYSGGIIGNIYSGTVNIKDATVSGSSENNSIISGYSDAGGLVGTSKGTIKADKCEVNNYNMQSSYFWDARPRKNWGDASGGLVGRVEGGKAYLKNSKVSDCNIQNSGKHTDKPLGAVVGACCCSGGVVNGYNILIDNVQFDKTTDGVDSTTKGDIIGQLGCDSGSNTQSSKFVGVSLQNNTPAGKNCGSIYDTKSTIEVIYSDYNGECVRTSSNTDVSNVNDTSNVSDMVNSPYATINPKVPINIDDSYTVLTGDGISETAIKNIIADETKYKNVGTEKNKFRVSGEYSRKLSTFNTELGLGVENDFPVLIVNDFYNKNTTDLINSYIHLLTNDSSIEKYDEKESGKYQVVISQYKYDSTTKQFTTSDTQPTLKQTGTEFSMVGDNKYDNVLGQFTLIDVQYFAPNTSNVAYHLYIPVVVEKMLNFEFKVGALSGTTYKADSYTSRLGLPVLENYGTPVTAHVTYSYQRTAEEWASAINGGEMFLKGYGKSVKLDGNVFPSGTKIALVDRNSNDKVYYYTTATDSESTIDFSNFKASDGTTPFTSVSLNDLIEKSATITAEVDATNGTLVECESTNATVKIDEKYYRPKTDEDTDSTKWYTASLSNSNESNDILSVEENYYLSFFTNENTTGGMKNISLTCASKLGDDGMTPTHKVTSVSSNNKRYDIVHIILGNLYDQNFTFSTNSDVKITETNNVINGKLSTTIKLKEEDKAKVLTYFGDSSIHLYHSFIIDATMTKEDMSTETGIKGNIAVSGTYKIDDSAETNITSELNGSVIEFGIVDIKNNLENPDGVTITCDDLTITYPDESDIVAQFPERKTESDSTGTVYSAKSNLSYTTDNIQQSTISGESKDTNGKSYYRENILSAKLSYNIPSYDPNEMTNLGVNGLETNNTVKADGYYYVGNLPQSALDKAKQVKFTLSLEKKNDSGTYDNDNVNISEYLKDVKFEGKDQYRISGISYVYTVNKDSLTYESGSYVVDTVFNVITGNEFETQGYTYANYKVKLTAELLDSNGNQIENSLCEDYIIYTNAKIFTEMISQTTT